MSDRDRQRKHEQENNISGSLYARVNVGQDASQDISDGSSVTPIAGSMNNADERAPYDSHSPASFFVLCAGIWVFCSDRVRYFLAVPRVLLRRRAEPGFAFRYVAGWVAWRRLPVRQVHPQKEKNPMNHIPSLYDRRINRKNLKQSTSIASGFFIVEAVCGYS